MTNKHDVLTKSLTKEDISSSSKFLDLMCDWLECGAEDCDNCTIFTMKKTLKLLNLRKLIDDLGESKND